MSSYVVRDCVYCAAVSCMMFGQTVRAAQQCMQRAVRFSVVVAASTARVQVMLLCVCSACVCKTAKHVTSFPHTLRQGSLGLHNSPVTHRVRLHLALTMQIFWSITVLDSCSQ